MSQIIVDSKKNDLQQRVTAWLETMRVEHAPIYTYRMSRDSDATVFNSCFAVFIFSLFNQLDHFSDGEKKSWLEYLLNFQQADTGLCVDPEAKERVTDATHNERHIQYQLTTFCLSAVEALGGHMRYPLRFLEEFKTAKAMAHWLDSLDWRYPWNSGNKVMFLAICLIYQWEHFNDSDAKKALDVWFDWMDAHQNPKTGFWGTTKSSEYFQGMGGFYHQFVIYNYMKHPVQYADKIVDRCLFLQQHDGLYYPGGGGGSCDDIDGVDPLVHFYHKFNYRRDEIRQSLQRSLAALLDNQNEDGGFCWAKLRPLASKDYRQLGKRLLTHRDLYHWYWNTRVAVASRTKSHWNYKIRTGWNSVARTRWDSSLFDTWLRCTAIGEICSVLTDEPLVQIHWKFLKAPGVGWFTY